MRKFGHKVNTSAVSPNKLLSAERPFFVGVQITPPAGRKGET